MPEPSFAERVGSRMRECRQRQRLTRKTVAEKAGVSASHLGTIERGRCCVSLVRAVNIAHALGVRLSDLL